MTFNEQAESNCTIRPSIWAIRKQTGEVRETTASMEQDVQSRRWIHGEAKIARQIQRDICVSKIGFLTHHVLCRLYILAEHNGVTLKSVLICNLSGGFV